MAHIPQKTPIQYVALKFHSILWGAEKRISACSLHSDAAGIALFGRIVRGVPFASEHCSRLRLEPAQVLAATFKSGVSTVRFLSSTYTIVDHPTIEWRYYTHKDCAVEKINSACVIWVTQIRLRTPESDHYHWVYRGKMSACKHVEISLILFNLSRRKFIWAQTPSYRTEYPAKEMRIVAKQSSKWSSRADHSAPIT
jgi:hypothetical protein